jgi:hypothetical protein
MHESDQDPHHSLNNPASDPDPTEWPDPYDRRPDPLDPEDDQDDFPHAEPGATSTSQPHADQDPVGTERERPEHERKQP